MKPYYYGITHEGKRDICETRDSFQISRQVFGSDEIIKNKEQRVKEIPYCSVLDSLEKELKARVNEILDDEDCMTDLDGLNID